MTGGLLIEILGTEGQACEIDVLVGLIAGVEDPESAGELTDRICEAVCRSTSLTRAAMFLHDPTLGVSRPVGSHGVDQELIASVSATLDEMPVAQRVLVEDRVIEVSQNLEFELPAHLDRIVTAEHPDAALQGFIFEPGPDDLSQ